MAAKPRNPMQGAHTSGIFADMTVDGPVIGTLVAIVDRAKNLPNRKTIGKQDPYCAARLGKEAKKTTTDIRGGQTPKWDQELRFTAHDSPDYYQLKVSVFNDDKRTDLIGETWIDLRDIIISGGGQSDQWHTLSCKGKYAGEVRMEITYYDSRPKPEKPAAKPKPVPSEAPEGPRGSRSPVKRRPLPSDPVTGETPASPMPAPLEHASTPPRALPKGPVGYIPNQSPLQSVEYNTPPPPHRHHPQDSFGHSPHSVPAQPPYGTSPARQELPNPQTPQSVDRYDGYAGRYDDRDYSPRHQHQPSYDRRESRGHHPHPSDQFEQFDASPVDRFRQELPGDDETPPPPPVHRSRHNSNVTAQDMMVRTSFETPPKNPSPMRQEILKQEAHRRAPSYPGRPSYRPYDSAPAVPAPLGSPADDQYHQPSPPRHHSYDNGFDPHRSMQPTVEDVPESPTPIINQSQALRRVSHQGQYEDELGFDRMGYDNVPTPAPLNLAGRGSAQSDHFSTSPQPRYQGQDDYSRQPTVSPLSLREYGHSPAEVSQPSQSSQGYHSDTRSELQGNEIQVYGMPSVPPSLVPGVDPVLAQEVSERIHEERRNAQRRYAAQNATTPTRGRQHSDAHYGYGGSPQAQAPPQSYDRAVVTYSGSPSHGGQLVKARSVSPIPPPNPNHTIKRKSVSPAPPLQDGSEGGRRLSGIPFGPDSYDMLNPSLVGEKESKPDPDAKIITHDGREIDPSDHLPMDTWAPEPEQKQPKNPSPESTRQRPAGAQPMPQGGRRPLRVAGRPHSQSAAPAPLQSYGHPDEAPTPPSGGRNRLQKKTHRQSALPAPPPAGSSPLGPNTSFNYQDNGSGFTPPRLPRASTWDYPNENHAPQYGSSPTAPRGMAPPVPAKVPLPIMSGALTQNAGGPGGGQDWALMQEMSRIDIGAGRSRRHGGGY